MKIHGTLPETLELGVWILSIFVIDGLEAGARVCAECCMLCFELHCVPTRDDEIPVVDNTPLEASIVVLRIVLYGCDTKADSLLLNVCECNDGFPMSWSDMKATPLDADGLAAGARVCAEYRMLCAEACCAPSHDDGAIAASIVVLLHLLLDDGDETILILARVIHPASCTPDLQ